jgi:glutathione S-transferase
LAKKFNLAGKDEFELAEIEMYADQVVDLQVELVKVRFEQDETKKAAGMQKLSTETVPNSFKILEARLAKTGSGFLAPSGLSWADLFLVYILEWMGDLNLRNMDSFKHLKALYEKVMTNPKIAEWIAKRPATQF